jgi:Mg2+ and Co2+ transporter CorA
MSSSTFDVPHSLAHHVGRSVGRQRVITDDGVILVVLHKPPIDDYWKREGVFLLKKVNTAWHFKGERTTRTLLDSYRNVARNFDEEFEDASTPSALFALLDRLVPVRRSARNVHAVLAEAGKMLPDDMELADWINFAYETERGLDLLYDDIRHTIDSHLARIEEEHMELTKQSVIATNRLNLIVALFLPLATIASVLGMNLSHGLNTDDPRYFLIILLLGILMGLGVLKYIQNGTKPKNK